MKYETPELTAVTPAINAIQGGGLASKGNSGSVDQPIGQKEPGTCAYADWED